MQHSRELYERYLEELQSLEQFRLNYLARHPGVPLDREDPDVQRLLEALAFFTARSRHQVRQNQLRTTRRLFRDFFSYLLDPLPAIAILQAGVTGRFVEVAELPRGTEVMIRADYQNEALFFTLWDLRVLPVRLASVELIDRPGKGPRILMRVRAAYARSDEIGSLSILIDQLSDYTASLQLKYALQRHLTGVQIAFGDNVTSQTEGDPAIFSFGPPRSFRETRDRFTHPVERLRSRFHFPQQDLYLNVEVAQTPHLWQHFTLIFDLDAEWPKDLGLSDDSFRLGTVPILNMKRAPCEPFEVDGTQSRHPILFPEPGDAFELHSVHAVYELTDRGMRPIQPGSLPLGGSSFECELDDLDTKEANARSRRAWVNLKMPEAFLEPRRLVVDAWWHQPWFSDFIEARLDAWLYDRSIVGLDWQLVTRIVPTRANPLAADVEGLLQILALRMKSELRLDEVLLILRSLGSIERSPFKNLPALMDSLEITRLPPDEERSTALKLRYSLKLRPFDESLRPHIEVFFHALKDLLMAWIPETIIELRLSWPESDDTLDIR